MTSSQAGFRIRLKKMVNQENIHVLVCYDACLTILIVFTCSTFFFFGWHRIRRLLCQVLSVPIRYHRLSTTFATTADWVSAFLPFFLLTLSSHS